MSDNEIKVLLTADLANLQEGMTAGAEAVQANTEAMAAAVQEAAGTIQEAQAAVAESVGAATQALQASMEEAAAAITGTNKQTMESVAAEAAAFNAAVQAKIEAQTRLNTAFAGGIGSAAAIAEAEAALDQAMAAGALTASDYSAYIERLNMAEIELAASSEAATVATDANTEAMVVNAGVARELGVIMGELARGNTARLEGSLFTLGNRAGLTSMLFTPMGAAIAAAGASVIAFGVAAVKGAEEQAKFNDAILMTGGAAGVSSGAVQAMANRIGEATGSFTEANEAMLALVKSGRFTADELERVGTAAVQMAQLTGESVDKAVQQFVKLQEKPVQAVVQLNDQYHFLTAAVFDQIEALAQQGDVQGAAAVGQQALSDALAKRAREAEQQLNAWGKTWHALGEEASWAWNAMKGLGKSSSLDDEIQSVNDKLTVAKNILSTLQGSSGDRGAMIEQTQQVNAYTDQLNELIQKRDEMRQKDAKDAADQALQQKTIGDIAAQNKLNESLKYTSHLQEAIAEAKARAEEIHKTDPGSASIKGINFDASGAVAGGEQWDAITKKLTKEYGENLTGAIRTANAEAKKAAAEQMNDLEMQRAGTAANSTERIQSDAAVLASATRLYGANSSQQKSALAQMLADERSYDTSVRALNLERLQASHDEATGEIETKRQQHRAEYAEGQISAQQLLDIERELAAQRLAIDTKYYQDKARLDAADPIAVARDDSAIVKAQQTMQQTLARAEQQFHANSLSGWKEHAKQIEGAMQSAINGMLFQHQTLRQGIASVALVIGEDFIQEAVMKPLDKWIAAEAMKVSASVSTSTTLQAQRVADSIAEATQSTASVARAAGVAGANGLASFAAAPWPIDIGAPAFGATMAAAALSFAPVASAAGGWERVPFDGAMTELHRDEMVLPKHIADPVRQMAKRGAAGGDGGGGDIHIHATDAPSVKRLLLKNKGALVQALKEARRRGHF